MPIDDKGPKGKSQSKSGAQKGGWGDKAGGGPSSASKPVAPKSIKGGTGTKSLTRAVQKSFGEKADKKKLVPADLGAYVNGVKTIKVVGRPDFVWARIRSSTSEVVQVYNDKVSEIWDLPVLIYREPEAPDIWRVEGRDVRRYQDWGGVSSIPPHGASHSFSQADKTGVDPVWVYKRQYMPFLPRPVASGTMQLYVESDFYQWGGGFRWFGGTGTANLTSHKPTGAVNARFVTVYLEGDSGQVGYLDGPEFPVHAPPADPGRFISIPSPHDAIPIAAVILMTGTSFIGWGEIYDLRYPMTTLQGSGSAVSVYDEGVARGEVESLDFLGQYVTVTVTGSRASVNVLSPGVDQIGVYGLDDGVPRGTGTSVDWGDGFSVSISGSRLRIDGSSQTPVPATGTIVAWDDGVLKGSFPIIDFGSNLSLTFSGSVLRVDAAAGGGGGAGGLGVMNWDDGVPVGTGTIIDWGTNLTASLSGTVLRVNASASGGATATGIFTVEELIYETTLNSLNGVVLVTGIPQTYQHLSWRLKARTNRAGSNNEGVDLFMNGDTGSANYRSAGQFGGAAPGGFSQDGAFIGTILGSTATIGIFGINRGDYPDYMITGTFPQWIAFGGERRDATTEITWVTTINWEKYESPVSMRFSPSSGNQFISGSHFQVFGIRQRALSIPS